MADIQLPTKQKGVRKCKKLSTRVDLTPMVDLGFLLITFFIFTTITNSPVATTLVMPNETDLKNPTKIPKSKVLQILLAENNKLYYYFGNDAHKSATTSFASNGLRKVIINKQEAVAKKYGSKKELILIIKPLHSCNLQNVTNVLDEVQINGVTRYVLSEPTKQDLQIASIKH